MANLRDISRRMASVKATMQITRTMEMVSTAKIRAALERAEEAGPYKDAITRMLAHVAHASSAADQPLLEKHEAERSVLFIVIASDRGLAGGFNIVPERSVHTQITELLAKGIKCSVITCGKEPTDYFRSRVFEPVMSFEGQSSEPTMDQADRIASFVMDGYEAGSYDRVSIVYHHARNRMEQVLVTDQLLPVEVADEGLSMPNDPREGEEGMQEIQPVHGTSAAEADYTFDPSAAEVLGYLIPAYVRTVIYHALLDSAAAEHGARRRAMQSATDNATAVVANLSRTYNRVRQGSITTELTEIVGGASALEEGE